MEAIEADTFWCLSRLLDGIQDNYISAQPGIHRSVKRMAELVARIDARLYEHLTKQNVEFMQFAFRWMNCLLMREISVANTIRMWDTYLVRVSVKRRCSRLIVHSLCLCRRKAPMRSHNSICTYVLRSSYDGARSCERWIFRYDSLDSLSKLLR